MARKTKTRTKTKVTTTGKGTMGVRQAGRLGGRKVQKERDLRSRKQVRGRAYDKPGPAKGSAFGIAAITRALEGLGFPAQKHEVIKKAGRQKIQYRKGQPVDLSKIVSDLDAQEFPSMSNVVKAVSGALKQEGLSPAKH